MSANPVTRTLLGWLMRSARVTAIEQVSPHFRLIDLEGEALKDVAWTPGEKLQVSIGGGFATRTYTPMSWDAVRGRTRLLAFMHGEGPGSRWAGSLSEGDNCQFFGPRRSLDLASPAILFGDETSFGLAAALPGAYAVFEVSDAAEARMVLAAIGLDQAMVIERTADEAHLATVETELLRLGIGDVPFVLTGKASSIQRINRALKAAGARLKTKAYWAPGKVGLD